MVPPSVGDGEGLHDAADGLAGAGSEYEMDVVGHQAVGVEVEGVSSLGLCEGFEVGKPIAVGVEDVVAVVAAIQRVED